MEPSFHRHAHYLHIHTFRSYITNFSSHPTERRHAHPSPPSLQRLLRRPKSTTCDRQCQLDTFSPQDHLLLLGKQNTVFGSTVCLVLLPATVFVQKYSYFCTLTLGNRQDTNNGNRFWLYSLSCVVAYNGICSEVFLLLHIDVGQQAGYNQRQPFLTLQSVLCCCLQRYLFRSILTSAH
jgi:hypothetical protein